VFLGHFAKKRTPNPILCLLSYSLNRFKRVLKLTLASLIIYIYIYYNRPQLIVVVNLSSEVGDFGFAIPENIAKNTDF
jgi:hypothetical protein